MAEDPNTSNENASKFYGPTLSSFVAAGNVPEMKSQLMQFKFIHDMFNRLNFNEEGYTRPIPYSVKGKAYITLHFQGLRANTLVIHKVEKRLYLVKDDPRTIPLNRIQDIANNIKSKFDSFSFQTGKKSFTYNNPEQGFNRNWGYFQDITHAQRLYEQMLDITGFSPNWELLSEGSIPLPGNRFNDPPEKVLQANVLVETEIERPVATMKFKKAKMKLPHVRSAFDVVTDSLDIIEQLPF